MKRILAGLLIGLGLVLAGCEGEEYEHHGFRGREFREGEFRHHEFRLMDQTQQNDGMVQVESTVEP